MCSCLCIQFIKEARDKIQDFHTIPPLPLFFWWQNSNFHKWQLLMLLQGLWNRVLWLGGKAVVAGAACLWLWKGAQVFSSWPSPTLLGSKKNLRTIVLFWSQTLKSRCEPFQSQLLRKVDTSPVRQCREHWNPRGVCLFQGSCFDSLGSQHHGFYFSFQILFFYCNMKNYYRVTLWDLWIIRNTTLMMIYLCSKLFTPKISGKNISVLGSIAIDLFVKPLKDK